MDVSENEFSFEICGDKHWVGQKHPRIAAAVLRVDELYSGAEKLI